MKKTAESRMKELYSKYPVPPIEVIVPVLEKAGRGEQELAKQLYDTYVNLATGMKTVLGLEEKNMKTLVRVWVMITSYEGMKIEPIEVSDSKFSFSLDDCPMIHVGKDIGLNVESKFCDLVCTNVAKALLDTILGSDMGILSWSKALIKGAGKCTVTFESLHG
jgi:hypothetical protein